MLTALTSQEAAAKPVGSKPASSRPKHFTSLLAGILNTAAPNQTLVLQDKSALPQSKNLNNAIAQKASKPAPKILQPEKNKKSAAASVPDQQAVNIVPDKPDTPNIAPQLSRKPQNKTAADPALPIAVVQSAKPAEPVAMTGRPTIPAQPPAARISHNPKPISHQPLTSRPADKPQAADKPVIFDKSQAYERTTAANAKPKRDTDKPLLQETPEPKPAATDNAPVIENTQPNVTGKPSIPDAPRLQVTNVPFAALQNHIAAQSKVPANHETPAQAPQHPTIEKISHDSRESGHKARLPDLPADMTPAAENLPLKIVVQKAVSPQHAVQQPETRANQLLSNNKAPDIDITSQTLAVNDALPAVKEHSPAPGLSTKLPAGTDPAGISGQIQESIYNSISADHHQIVIRLNPPELGKVLVKFEKKADDVTGLIQVEKLHTSRQIRELVPEILQNLQTAGVQINKIEVSLADNQTHYNPHDQSSGADYNHSGHSHTPWQTHDSQNSAQPVAPWQADTAADSNQTESPSVSAPGSLNLLM